MRKAALASIVAVSWVILFAMVLSTTTWAATASFVRTDATTEGSWIGAYGADGYVVSQDTHTQVPSYAQVTGSGYQGWTWTTSTTALPALQTPENPSNRIAGTWYQWNSFTLNVNLTDGNAHQVALYALDWDSSARSETINVLDAVTGAVLDSKVLPAGSFHTGEYLVWSVTGSVQFQIISDAGANAVISGLFFDTPKTSVGLPVNTKLPVISGTAQVGNTLTSSTGTWTGATSFAYQWSGDGTPIAGATASTYTPAVGDVGRTVTVTVTATGPGGAASATSAATAPVAAAAPMNLQLPVISGIAQVGKVLTSSTGTWTGATSFVYQWAKNNAPISAAVASTYTPVSSDVGATLTSTVTATGAGGTASATSAPTVPIVGGSGGGGSTSFVALHTYYISPTGKDSNPGTSASPWLTPKHAVNCGDVIIASAGSYTAGQFGTGRWGTVSNCPSTSGGIDGKGGIYFATVLCAGPYINSCTVSNSTQEPFRVDASNWAVEGFSATQPASAAGGCFIATAESNATLHHIAFINNIASGCALAGFATYSWQTEPNGGVDQTAVVGAITYNATPSTNGGGICGSGISLIPNNGPDTSSGTHVFVAGTFNYKNINAPSGAGCNTDGEGLIFDSWGVNPYKYTGVAEQNVFWSNGSAGFQAFPQGNHTTDDLATVVIFNNTSYGNFQDTKRVGGGGELFLNQVYPNTGGGSYTITNNIFEATMPSPGNNGSGQVFGAEIDCLNSCPGTVINISGNYIWNSHSPTTTTVGGTNTHAWYGGANQGGNWPWGTNTYNNPGLASPGSLPTTAPNCSGYTNTTACMSGLGVLADVVPSGGAAAKGYQPPGPCAADAYYPTWLKGMVYLTVSGPSITENAGLITTPCGM